MWGGFQKYLEVPFDILIIGCVSGVAGFTIMKRSSQSDGRLSEEMLAIAKGTIV